MKPLFFRALVSISAVCLALVFGTGISQGQTTTSGWSNPERIPGTSARAHWNFGLIPDHAGFVHLLWTQEDSRGATISYSRWDGSSWSPAVDILLSPIEGPPRFLGGTVDSTGVLHVVFYAGIETDGRIFYTRARSWEAGSARNWTPPVEVARGAWASGDVAVTPSGDLTVLFGQQDAAYVNATVSKDGGRTWSQPVTVSGDCVGGSLVAGIDTTVDGSGRIHAVWYANNERAFGEMVCYARTSPGKTDWLPARIVDIRGPDVFGVGFASVASIGKDEIHLIWQGVSGPPGRLHRFSKDGGETWSPPTLVFGVVGQNGPVGPMAVDSAGQLHAVSHGRYTETEEIHGLFYFAWDGNSWSSRSPIAEGTLQEMFDPQNPQLVSFGGNRLLTVYGNDPPRGLWFSTYQTGAPPVPPEQYQAATSPPAVTLSPTPGPQQSDPPTRDAIPTRMTLNAEPFTAPPSQADIVLAGVFPALALAGLVVLGNLGRRFLN